jgi:hypothetical protein
VCFNFYYKKENCIDRWCLSRPPIIRSHDLHVDDIRETMGEIMSYCNQKEKGR